MIPRTGAIAGRSVLVEVAVVLQSALRNLNMIDQANKIRRVLSLRQYHERPGKVNLRLRNEKTSRDFKKGVGRVFDLVSETRRKGY
jgi:hypothetical protein